MFFSRRLSAQHHMLHMRNGSLFVGPLDEALEEARIKNYGVPTVLDVGCGGGESSLEWKQRKTQET